MWIQDLLQTLIILLMEGALGLRGTGIPWLHLIRRLMAVEAVQAAINNSDSLSVTGRPGGSATTWMSYQNTGGNGRGDATS